MTEKDHMSDTGSELPKGSEGAGKPGDPSKESITPDIINEVAREELDRRQKKGQRRAQKPETGKSGRPLREPEASIEPVPTDDAEDNEEQGAPGPLGKEELAAKVLEFRPRVVSENEDFEQIIEDAEKMFELNTSPDDFFRIAQKLGLTRENADQLEDLCRQQGIPEGKIQIIKEKLEKLPKGLDESELTDEEKEEFNKAKQKGGEIDELQGMNKEAKALMDKAAAGQLTEKDFADFSKRALTTMDKVKAKFFYGEDSVLRSEDRVKRLLLKPLATILVVTMVVYLACLASLTRGSTKKIG